MMNLIRCEGFRKVYPADPIYYLGLEDYSDIMRDGYLFIASAYNEVGLQKYKDKERIFLTFEEPNFCTDKDNQHARLSEEVDTILTICPYTTEADFSHKRKTVFLPYNESHINLMNKEFDVIYSGSFPQVDFWEDLMHQIKVFKYIDIQYQRGNFKDVSYKEKLNLYSKSKIALCHNLSPVGTYKERFEAFPNAKNNKAFSHLDKGLLPQIKYRTIEAAFNKCIILCYKDYWNIIERYLEPEKDFLYFETKQEAMNLIYKILSNYDDYFTIAENAYNKVVNKYTTKHFCEEFLT